MGAVRKFITGSSNQLPLWSTGEHRAAAARKAELEARLVALQHEHLAEAHAAHAVAVRTDTESRARALINGTASQAGKAVQAAATAIEQIRAEIDSTQTAIAILEERLPQLELEARRAHVRDEVQPRVVAMVEKMAPHLKAVAELQEECWALFRGPDGIDSQYPANIYGTPETFKPVGMYVTSGPKVITPLWPALMPGKAEDSTPLRNWIETLRDAGYSI